MRAFEFIPEVLDTKADVTWGPYHDGQIGSFNFDGLVYNISIYPIPSDQMFGAPYEVGYEIGFGYEIGDDISTTPPISISHGNKVYSIVYNIIKDKLMSADVLFFIADNADGNMLQRAKLYNKIANYSGVNKIDHFNERAKLYCLAVSKHQFDDKFKQKFIRYVEQLSQG